MYVKGVDGQTPVAKADFKVYFPLPAYPCINFRNDRNHTKIAIVTKIVGSIFLF